MPRTSRPLEFPKRFVREDAREWGTPHNFALAGTGDEFNGWTYTMANFAAAVCAFSGAGLLTMGGSLSAGVGNMKLAKTFTGLTPIAAWPILMALRALDMTGTNNPGGATGAFISRLTDGTFQCNSKYKVPAGGFGTADVELIFSGDRGVEFGGVDTADWSAAALSDRWGIDAIGAFLYTTQGTPGPPGEMKGESRVIAGSTADNMRCMPDPTTVDLTVEFELQLPAGCTLVWDVEISELDFLVY